MKKIVFLVFIATLILACDKDEEYKEFRPDENCPFDIPILTFGVDTTYVIENMTEGYEIEKTAQHVIHTTRIVPLSGHSFDDISYYFSQGKLIGSVVNMDIGNNRYNSCKEYLTQKLGKPGGPYDNEWKAKNMLIVLKDRNTSIEILFWQQDN